MNDSHRVDFLQGQMQVMIGFCFAIIETHPRPNDLLVLLRQNCQAAIAKASESPVGDALIDGIQDMEARLLKYAGSVAVRQDQL